MELKLPPLAETGETLTGAEIVVRCLKEEGVEFVFGYPGGAVLHIYDAIFSQKAFSHILVRQEQAALRAADGYARATGRPGVALVTSGPGVTNAVTGIATAYLDSIPDEVPVVLDLIRSLKARRDRCILLVDHKMDVVRELADRIVVLHNRPLVADGEPAGVIASPIVQQAYLGIAAEEAAP